MKDGIARVAIGARPGAAIAWYLMASYAYYDLDEALISDGLYDEICHILLAMVDGDDLPEHRHAHLVTRDNLRAGTCLGVQYPHIVKVAACDLLGRPWPALVRPIRKRTRA